MNEKTKKILTAFMYRAIAAGILFLSVSVMLMFFPETAEKVSPVWTKNTDLKKTGLLLLKVFKELVPF